MSASYVLKDTDQKIYKNIHENNVVIYDCALGTNIDKVLLNRASNGGNSSSLLNPTSKLVKTYPNITYDSKLEVEQYPLDYFQLDANTLVIDTQGYELNVLKGAENTLKNIYYILTEVYDEELYSGCALFGEVDSFLKEHGFKLLRKDMTWAKWGNAFYTRTEQ